VIGLRKGWTRPGNPARGLVQIGSSKFDEAICYRPLWSRRLIGTGQFFELQHELCLSATAKPRADGGTLLALDDDRRKRWFEFTVVVQRLLAHSAIPPSGLFFGWHEERPGLAHVYLIQMDDSVGQLVVGQAQYEKSPGSRDFPPTVLPLTPLPSGPQTSRLNRTLRQHHIAVRAVPGQVAIQIDQEPAIVFVPPFDPRGPLGIASGRRGARLASAGPR
jgi:hypothetical protein